MPKRITLNTDLDFYENLNELPSSFQKLVRRAEEASSLAYAPYSKFNVGAAMLLEDGEIVVASNQENAAYPSGMCAERSAVYWIGGNRPGKKIEMIAVVARPDNKDFVAVSPCGSCRQALLEYEYKQGEPIRMIMQTEGGAYLVADSMKSLLPVTFDGDSLLQEK
ncbi:cytidine deaminase [Limibacter armeniacum]|uniref:cytidine deaminase n=1 Tax=Limibacter armeniacum TaxID=466084 RepID=UPI002FE6364E